MKEELLEKLDVTDYKQASHILFEQLSGFWYMYDWLVIVYAPWTGYGHHGVTGGDFRIDRFRQKCLNDAQANIIIAWTPLGADRFLNKHIDSSREFFLDNYSGILGFSPKARLYPTGLINPQRVVDFNLKAGGQDFTGIKELFRKPQGHELRRDTRAFLEACPAITPSPSLLWAGPADFGMASSGDAVLSIPLNQNPAIPKELTKIVMENYNWLRSYMIDRYAEDFQDDSPLKYKPQYSYIVFRQGGPEGRGRNSKEEVLADAVSRFTGVLWKLESTIVSFGFRRNFGIYKSELADVLSMLDTFDNLLIAEAGNLKAINDPGFMTIYRSSADLRAKIEGLKTSVFG